MTRAGLVARVLIDSPLPQLDHLFDYSIPPELADLALPGVRVKVPLRSASRVAEGYLIEVLGAPEQAQAEAGAEFQGALSPIDGVVSAAQVLTPAVWQLARRLADRAAGNASDIIRLAVPPRQVRVEKAWLAARAAAGADAVPGDASSATDTVAFFTDYPQDSLGPPVLARQRLCVAAVPDLVPLPDGRTIGLWARTMAELAVATLAAGRSAVLVVPDYRDQDQVQAALDQLAPTGSVSRVDARQPNPDRYRAFLACLEPAPRIVLGNRSAVYAPAHDLGLIALWDDGDPLHSEPLSPYVHARDASLVRQGQADCALVFLGHSRTVEVQRLVEIGWLTEVHPARNRHPRVIPTDFQSEPDPQARAARIPTAAWLAAKEAVKHGPVLVQVASPGYAPMLACQSCKKSARCTTCQGPLGLASASATPSCRWCGALAADWACVHCDGRSLRVVTLGTGRTAEELGRAFPGARVIVADGDHQLQQLGAEPALVIATRGAEPIPTGGYRAILLLDGERMLARESLRVGEDCLRWWSNAAALAGPGAPVILVGVGGVLARSLNNWQPEALAAAELYDRRQLRFPPAVRVASVTGTAADVAVAVVDLAGMDGVDVLGPVSTEPGSAGPGSTGAPLVRAIVRFAYGSTGDDVARLLKAAIVRNAARRRRPKGAAFRPAPTLKVRFDDPELL
ncbi:primosomal protein N' [Cryobacterium sp. TMT1-21]|uniref:Probable replication restart protein PriA n=1 Tax=Cryobacterium shii TaxID=1259235 RepID=A0AAQ2C8M8_9MICO|nr:MULTISPECIES: primosomal protein N' [Cryobacterium]TFC51637.1 primosomal protein N' [Cryobacterium shii]TFC83632.1 primosomal protein N' [Cryobacterium sp. TmT2-59]TFD13605.1 primosomal protein N' [Cryobacterium sp. TMT4-10]TFD16033.1 primosomal protein N' [Cryobacterium sp. TMT1-21]TFD27123.1 primosomal protein N' [Cryobacterium sp. TMT2-23]